MQIAAIAGTQPKDIGSIGGAEDALALLARVGAPLGLPYALVVSTRHGSDGLIGMRPVATNLPAALVDRHIDAGRIAETPFFSRFSQSLLPSRFCLDDLRPWGNPRERQAARETAENLDGLAFPVHAGTGVLNVVGFLGAFVRLDADTRDQLHLLAIHVVDRLRGLSGPAPSVSRRQLDCMRWIAAGKTSQEIADLLDISEHTVNHHIAAACARLGAATRAQALAKLMRMNAL